MVGEGEWRDFIQLDVYRNTKEAAEISYVWDEVIQRTCQNALDGRLLGNADLLRGRSAVQEMATEPRYFRRALSQRVVDAINTFPDNPDQLTRKLSYFPSSQPGNGYVFLQLRVDVAMRAEPSISVQLL